VSSPRSSVLPLAFFPLAVFGLSEKLERASLRAAGSQSDTGAKRRSDRRQAHFGSSIAQTLRRKEWRLLYRDQGVFAQLALQIIYTAPLAVVLVRSIDSMPLATAMSPTIVVIAAQIAASLAWITVSGEDAPELIASAPVRRGEVELAKITAGNRNLPNHRRHCSANRSVAGSVHLSSSSWPFP
jgi:ABC-2 type transport system permease protein